MENTQKNSPLFAEVNIRQEKEGKRNVLEKEPGTEEVRKKCA